VGRAALVVVQMKLSGVSAIHREAGVLGVFSLGVGEGRWLVEGLPLPGKARDLDMASCHILMHPKEETLQQVTCICGSSGPRWVRTGPGMSQVCHGLCWGP
jgi:hypothetical protein